MVLTHEQWIAEEGGVERPTHISTLRQQCQQKRIAWLMYHAEGTILEVGCNWGYVVNKCCRVPGRTGYGVDLNPENIKLAKEKFPEQHFFCGDALRLEFGNAEFDTVILPDVLEHIEWEDVPFAIAEAKRVSKEKILITLPFEETKKHCFKHRWIVETWRVSKICELLGERSSAFHDKDFYYILHKGE